MGGQMLKNYCQTMGADNKICAFMNKPSVKNFFVFYFFGLISAIPVLHYWNKTENKKKVSILETRVAYLSGAVFILIILYLFFGR